METCLKIEQGITGVILDVITLPSTITALILAMIYTAKEILSPRRNHEHIPRRDRESQKRS